MGMNTYRIRHEIFRHKRLIVHQDHLIICTRVPNSTFVYDERSRRKPGRLQTNMIEVSGNKMNTQLPTFSSCDVWCRSSLNININDAVNSVPEASMS